MDRLKKARGSTRSGFTRALNALRTELEREPKQIVDLQVSFSLLKDKASELEEIDRQFNEAMLDEETITEEMIDQEAQSAEEYRARYHHMKITVSRIVEEEQRLVQPPLEGRNQNVDNPIQRDNKRAFKLPKMELKKFGGEIRDWLQFWSQFKNIHEDVNIPREDKFQYLLQTMLPDSRASELVLSYPPTAQNYEKAIASLKNRFGRDELLVEVYVRELLKLVLSNAITPKGKVSLASVYDKLETHIRSLESLGVTTDTCAAMLYPLVESSLPEDLLRAWQRHTSVSCAAKNRAVVEGLEAVPIVNTPKDRLTNLMAFLQAEVENEERIAIAVSGFGLKDDQTATKDKYKKKKTENNNEIATAAGLLATKENRALECVFCCEGHESQQCEKARKMTLEERQECVKRKNACFNCLKKGHSKKFCKFNGKCEWCGRKHVLLVCRGMPTNNFPSKTSTDTTVKRLEENNLANLSLNAEVFLQTLRVKLRNGVKQRIIRAVIDSGSHRSYILRKTAEDMGYEEIGQQKVIHLLFGGTKTKPVEHKGYQIHLTDLDETYACNFVALDQETICHSIPTVCGGSWIQELKKSGVHLTDAGRSDESVSLLIGADIMGKLLTGKLENLQCGATAIQTRLGWTLTGKRSRDEDQRVDSALLAVSMLVREANVTDLWGLDVLGITDPIERKSKEVHQEAVKADFQQNVTVDDNGRYEVVLPWKESHPPLPNNKEMAIKRLETTTKKLKMENLLEQYQLVLEEWLTEGIIEKVPRSEMSKHAYYLPHRHVVKENSTTQLRPVFDASAKSKDSPSLNQCLETGPNLIELIPTILLRFRKSKIGVIADIRKAFLQISIAPRDRDVLRFLWWDRNDPTKMEIYRHCRVVFGVSSSPFLLGATIELHLQRIMDQTESEEDKEIIRKLADSFYVDNCVTSVDSEIELHEFQNEATNVMRSGAFDLRGWEHTGPLNSASQTSVLGLTWDKREDTLTLSKSAFEQVMPATITKRYVLSATQKIFDPIGLVCPVLLRPKLLLQELWASNLSWDAEVPINAKETFEKWFEELPLLKELRVPRWVFGDDEPISFHMFVDASQNAYAAALFVRVETKDRVQVQLIHAKARVAPKGNLTIPRLELLAATVGARLMKFTLQALNVEAAETHYWSDSSTVLSWIHEEKQWATFVWNRVQEIRQLSKPDEWKHIPGSLNPADLPSRGCTVRRLLDSRWWEGPGWLYGPREEWPSVDYVADASEVVSEIKGSKIREKVSKNTALSIPRDCVMSNSETLAVKDTLLFVRGLSKYPKILRMVAWIERFASNCRKSKDSRDAGVLTAKDITMAELKLFRHVQHTTFNGVKDTRIKDLDTFEDRMGLIRLKTLVSNREDTFEFRNPVVLNRQHPLIARLIQHRHEKLNHAGIQIVMNDLREQVWILSSRQAIRSVLAKCTICKRQKVARIEAPPAVLPEERVRDAAAFEVSGVDFAGPVYFKGGQKAWICLFTCAVYRAIHLELASTLSTEVFLEAFRRFIARRGRPTIMYSDNGTNFTGADNAIRSVNWDKIAEFSSVNKIEWHFNPPTAAWWGGWWERLVRSVKELLRRSLRRACLTAEELNTTLCDCEAIINSRPITYLSEDPSQLAALTPAMFLQDLRENGVPDLDQVEQKSLNRRLRYRQKLREDLRERFRSEYLGQLFRKNYTKTEGASIREGDVVLVGNEKQKRLDWPLARVEQVFPGRDGEVRVVRLKTAAGELIRPIQRLYPLEMSTPKIKLTEEVNSPPNDISTPGELETVPRAQYEHITTQENENIVEVLHTRSGRRVVQPTKLSL